MKTKNIEDIIKVEDDVIEISEINKILDDKDILDMYKKNYTNTLYKTIMLSLTHESYEDEKKAKNTFEDIVKHYHDLNTILKRDIGIVVATLDYLTNIINTLDVPKIIEEGKSETLAEISTIDELTTLYLRDIFDITLKKDIDESNRTSKPLSLIMIDIDDFKKVNDTYGHQKGDEVLKNIGQLLNSNVREMDTAARYGGEELAIIMPDTLLNQAFDISDRIRDKISKLDFNGFGVTVSMGISQTNNSINTVEKLVGTADESLYRAKHSGKNKVEKYQ
ncbi:MAG: GGDEF domain-containing protein [Campylobacterota bacterium]|nr:GGDEF domain-containing protein [Campylobacterota bacterium]